MRIESSVTAVSWIPSEAVTGAFKVPFEVGISRYDDPPSDVLLDVEGLVARDGCRFANRLSAWIDVDAAGRVSDYGVVGDGVVGSTRLKLGGASMSFAAVVFPTLRPEPKVGERSVTFTQTCGARTGVPAPRPVKRPPFFQTAAPTAWTTIQLTLNDDGSCEGLLVGASPFPRHWVYDSAGKLVMKSSYIDFKKWSEEHFGGNTPWGDADSPALVHACESALEREVSLRIMRGGAKPEIRTVPGGANLCEQGEAGDELYLLLDGVLEVLVNGEKVAELGPGAVLGERALLEGGNRTSTLRALVRCKVAVVSGDKVDRARLLELSAGHRREERR